VSNNNSISTAQGGLSCITNWNATSEWRSREPLMQNVRS